MRPLLRRAVIVGLVAPALAHGAAAAAGAQAPGNVGPARVAAARPAKDGRALRATFRAFVAGELARARHAGAAVPAQIVPGRLLPDRPPVPGPPVVGGVEATHLDFDVTLDATARDVDATFAFRVRGSAGGGGALGLVVDEGLTASDVTVDGAPASVDAQAYEGLRVVTVTFPTRLAADATAVVRGRLAGRLACTSSGFNGASCGDVGGFRYATNGVLFPYAYDPASRAYPPGLTRKITVRVPEGTDVVVTGEREREASEGGLRVSTWTTGHALSAGLGFYLFAGAVGRAPVAGRPVPTEHVFPLPRTAVDDRLVAWSKPVLDFTERFADTPLPFANGQTLVRLPRGMNDRGTATYAMTLLGEQYADAGELLHEETWAHENAHLFWGIAVPEGDASQSRLLSEGLATLAENDYVQEAHFADEDRDEHLAQRYRAIQQTLRLDPLAADLPPTWLPRDVPDEVVDNPLRYSFWAYYQTAAVLDHLRATVGDAPFRRALGAYARACSWASCGLDDFRRAVEAQAGTSLEVFFDRWVKGHARPAVTVGLERAGDRATAVVTLDDPRPVRLTLFVEREDGSVEKRGVELAPGATRVDVGAGVRAVRPSPRHEGHVLAASRVPGDLDFDGEADGLDLLACAREVGAVYDPEGTPGGWALAPTFQERCDVDHDGQVTRADLDALAAHFGTGREPGGAP